MSTKRMTVAEMEEEAQRLKNPETLVGQLYEAPDAVPRKRINGDQHSPAVADGRDPKGICPKGGRRLPGSHEALAR